MRKCRRTSHMDLRFVAQCLPRFVAEALITPQQHHVYGTHVPVEEPSTASMADIHSFTSSARAMSVGGIVRPSTLAVPKIHECPNHEPQTPARKRVMTMIIATCIVPWKATA